jgi:hypothetical protein
MYLRDINLFYLNFLSPPPLFFVQFAGGRYIGFSSEINIPFLVVPSSTMQALLQNTLTRIQISPISLAGALFRCLFPFLTFPHFFMLLLFTFTFFTSRKEFYQVGTAVIFNLENNHDHTVSSDTLIPNPVAEPSIIIEKQKFIRNLLLTSIRYAILILLVTYSFIIEVKYVYTTRRKLFSHTCFMKLAAFSASFCMYCF